MKIGIRIELTQETDTMTHRLFEIYDVKEIPDKRLKNLKAKAQLLINNFGVSK